MKTNILTLDEKFTAQLGKWWDSLSGFQRGMLIFAHRLNVLNISSITTWCQLDYSAQCEIALRLCVTFSITSHTEFPDPPQEYRNAANDTGVPVPALSLH